MHLKDNILKTLTPLGAQLIVTLYSLNRPIFHFKEAEKILGSRPTTSKILTRLIHNGVIVRLKSGMYCVVPYELGFEREYLGNPYIIARELMRVPRTRTKVKYFLSHGSAFDLHQMTTQPQLIVYISSPKMIRTQTIQGTEFRFVRCKERDIFGVTEMWINKREKICVSDLERTLLDGLKKPVYCGGFSDVAKGFSIRHAVINPQTLVDYAVKLNVGAVFRRLGYLMELYQIGSRIYWEYLQTKLTSSYELLDPELPEDGPYLARWKLNLNVSQDELLAIRGT